MSIPVEIPLLVTVCDRSATFAELFVLDARLMLNRPHLSTSRRLQPPDDAQTKLTLAVRVKGCNHSLGGARFAEWSTRRVGAGEEFCGLWCSSGHRLDADQYAGQMAFASLRILVAVFCQHHFDQRLRLAAPRGARHAAPSQAPGPAKAGPDVRLGPCAGQALTSGSGFQEIGSGV